MANVFCCSCKKQLPVQHCDCCYDNFSEYGNNQLPVDLQCTCIGVSGTFCKEWCQKCNCNVPMSNKCNCCGRNCCLDCSNMPGERCDCCPQSTLICNRCLDSCIVFDQIRPNNCIFKRNYCWSCCTLVGGKGRQISFKTDSGGHYCLKCFCSPYLKTSPSKNRLRKTKSC